MSGIGQTTKEKSEPRRNKDLRQSSLQYTACMRLLLCHTQNTPQRKAQWMLVPHGTPDQEEALLVHTYRRQISGLCRAALKDDGKGDALKGVMEVQLRGANVTLQKLAWISWNGS